MSSVTIPQQDTLGLAFSIAGLTLVAPVAFFFHSYSHSLDAVQMFYVFFLVLAPGTSLFSSYLGTGWLSFMPNFLNCSNGNYLCLYGNLVSPLICWAGANIILFIIFRLIAIKKPNLKYQSFYKFFRGFLRWTLPPLIYNSTTILIKNLQSQTLNYDFIASAIVLGFLVLVVFIELITFGCLEKKNENIWIKWILFFSQFRIISMMALLVLSTLIDISTKYVLYASILIYDIIYLIKYSFSYKIFERIIFILSEGAFLTIYSLFLFNQGSIIQYSLDFFGLAFIILLQIVMLLAKMYSHCKTLGEDNSEVAPQWVQDRSIEDRNQRKQYQKPKDKKVNSFVPDENIMIEQSFESLNRSKNTTAAKVVNKDSRKR